MSVMYGKPIRAFPEQDHEAHIAVHLQFIQDPSLGGNQGTRGLLPILIAHIAEHVALLYRQRMQAGINMTLPSMPDVRDPKFKFDDIDPQLDMIISQKAAEVVAKAPVMEAIKPLMAMQGQKQNPLDYAAQLAQLEAQLAQMRTKNTMEIDMAKAKQELDIKQAKAQQDIDIEQQKANQDLQNKVRELELELQLEREKNDAKIQKEINKNARPL